MWKMGFTPVPLSQPMALPIEGSKVPHLGVAFLGVGFDSGSSPSLASGRLEGGLKGGTGIEGRGVAKALS